MSSEGMPYCCSPADIKTVQPRRLRSYSRVVPLPLVNWRFLFLLATLLHWWFLIMLLLFLFRFDYLERILCVETSFRRMREAWRSRIILPSRLSNFGAFTQAPPSFEVGSRSPHTLPVSQFSVSSTLQVSSFELSPVSLLVRCCRCDTTYIPCACDFSTACFYPISSGGTACDYL